jgi:hypothetical protein
MHLWPYCTNEADVCPTPPPASNKPIRQVVAYASSRSGLRRVWSTTVRNTRATSANGLTTTEMLVPQADTRALGVCAATGMCWQSTGMSNSANGHTKTRRAAPVSRPSPAAGARGPGSHPT